MDKVQLPVSEHQADGSKLGVAAALRLGLYVQTEGFGSEEDLQFSLEIISWISSLFWEH